MAVCCVLSVVDDGVVPVGLGVVVEDLVSDVVNHRAEHDSNMTGGSDGNAQIGGRDQELSVKVGEFSGDPLTANIHQSSGDSVAGAVGRHLWRLPRC